MDSFLKLVAEDLYNRTQGKLDKVAVVFPNKRAGLFFNDYIASCSESPIWSPSYVSIKELFKELSDLEFGDPMKLVCELYKVYISTTGSNEPLDDFYSWGEMLISDFDDVDKNLADAERLFTNLEQLKEFDDFSFLEPEQEEAIKQFFTNFSIEKKTALKEKFISIWRAIGMIYPKYREELMNQGIAYEGMLYRDAIEKIDVNAMNYDTYVFIGFNVLSKVEHRLFTKLRDAGKAMFYWDYDKFYMENHNEAGLFINRNLIEFPSTLDSSLFDSMSKPKEIRFIAAPTENAQARYLPQWLRENKTEIEKETAVVLCNEALLQPVIHSLPESVQHVNVTMGFPISQTPIFSFLTSLVETHVVGYNKENGKFSYKQVIKLLKHPYTREISEQARIIENRLTKNNRFYPLPSELTLDNFLTLIFTPSNDNLTICKMMNSAISEIALLYKNRGDNNDPLTQLYRESLFQAYTIISRFSTLIEEGNLNIKPETFSKLLMRVFSSTNIPFHGEPAIGLQVMGLLETRNLDFKNIVMLSVNEGNIPKDGGNSSFIPYNLRKAFGLTTMEHKMSIYAFYFYRLLQRAEKITLLYNTTADGLNKGEWSRFMLQMLVDYEYPIVRESLETEQSPISVKPITIKKNAEVMGKLYSSYDKDSNPKARFSPSALNTYLDCSLKFYFKYVANLNVPDEVSAEIDSATFGSIFHRVAENIYNDLTQHKKVINKEEIENILKHDLIIRQYIDNAFKELFFNVPKDEKPEYNGIQLINSEVIFRYIKQLLHHDMAYAPFTFIGSEKSVNQEVEIKTSNGLIKSSIGGIIDRMDTKDGTLRIVDYKTGGDPTIPKDIESLFVPDKKRSGYIFQTSLYAYIMCCKQNDKVAPALLYIHKAASSDYTPIIQMGEAYKPKEIIDDFAKYADEFRERLDVLLEEIFNADIDFSQTEIEEKCSFCDFRKLCRR